MLESICQVMACIPFSLMVSILYRFREDEPENLHYKIDIRALEIHDFTHAMTIDPVHINEGVTPEKTSHTD